MENLISGPSVSVVTALRAILFVVTEPSEGITSKALTRLFETTVTLLPAGGAGLKTILEPAIV
jgi:hypothetical protein